MYNGSQMKGGGDLGVFLSFLGLPDIGNVGARRQAYSDLGPNHGRPITIWHY